MGHRGVCDFLGELLVLTRDLAWLQLHSNSDGLLAAAQDE
jgi:hypothetical protein